MALERGPQNEYEKLQELKFQFETFVIKTFGMEGFNNPEIAELQADIGQSIRHSSGMATNETAQALSELAGRFNSMLSAAKEYSANFSRTINSELSDEVIDKLNKFKVLIGRLNNLENSGEIIKEHFGITPKNFNQVKELKAKMEIALDFIKTGRVVPEGYDFQTLVKEFAKLASRT